MKRREFITVLGVATLAWPFARAQQSERVRRIGVLMDFAPDDAEAHARLAAFQQLLQKLGWVEGGNARIEYRWAGNDTDRLRKSAAELVALAPDVILANGTPSVAALRTATRSVPIVFVNVSDPIGAGFVASLARPSGNVTGFSLLNYGMSGKWLELLKEVAPRVTRAAVFRDFGSPSGMGQYGAIQAIAPSFSVELYPVDVHDPGDIDRTITEFARAGTSGLIVTASSQAVVHRDLLIALAARHRLPATYPSREWAKYGGFIAYGADRDDQYRLAAGYVDRILKGEKPSDLPVQQPAKFELVVNLKTAKSLGLTVPPALLARADEVLE